MAALWNERWAKDYCCSRSRFFEALLLCSLVVPLADARASEKQTLVYCSEGSPKGFDPAQTDSGIDFAASAQPLYNRLVEFERGGWDMEPGLAERWDMSSDARVYTFYLRRGVHFHTTPYFAPSRQMNADDVIWTFKRLSDPKHPFNLAYPVYAPYFAGMHLDALIAQVQKLDDHTVRITLKRPMASFIKQLGMPFGSILSEEYAQHLLAVGKAANINAEPIGTGPFIFHSYVKDSLIRFEGNPRYWKKDAVKLSKLIFDITPNAAVRVQKLKRGECDVTIYPPPTDLAALNAHKHIVVLSHAGFNTSYLSYNVLRAPLDQLLVRKALDMAIDRGAIIRSVYQDAAAVARTVMPPLVHEAALPAALPAYNPAQAKALLEKAGFADGLNVTLWAMSTERGYNPGARLMAQLIQADWARIGVHARIVTADAAAYFSSINRGEHDIALMGWAGDADDPDLWLTPLLACRPGREPSWHRWCDPRLDRILKQARESTDDMARKRLYVTAEKWAAEHLPISPIAHGTVFQPIRRSVQGMRLGPLLDIRFDGVSKE